MNHYPPTKGIQTCSYNDSGENLEAKVSEQPRRERAAGKEFVNHLMLRNGSDAKDHLKFNLLLGGIPLFLYNLFSMHKAGFTRIATVGNEDTGRIHKLFCDYFNIDDFVFVPEGEPSDWSLSNTIVRGKRAVNPTEEDNVLFCPGDAPFVNIKELARNKYAADYDFIVPFNTKELCGSFFPRNYHFSLIDDVGNKYLTKESNALLMNLAKINKNRFGDELYDMAFGARKTYAIGHPQQKFFAELIFKSKGKFSLKRTAGTISKIGAAGFFSQITRYALRQAFNIKENDKNVPTLKAESCAELVEHALDVPGFKAKLYPTLDAAALMDMDSFEDVIFAQAILQLAPSLVYPHYDELKAFADKIRNWGCNFTDNWHDFANEKFKKYDIRAEYVSPGVLSQEVFSKDRLLGQVELIRKYRETTEF